MKANCLTTIADQLAALGEIDRTYGPLGRQVYVLTPAADLPGYLQPRGSACTGPFMDLNAKPYLESLGRWRGRGFCVAMSHEPAACPATWFSILLHEAAHDVANHATEPRAALYGSQADVCDLSERELIVAMAQRSGVQASWRPPQRPNVDHGRPWEGHHLHWIRAVCHLAYRSRAWFGGKVMPSLEVGTYVAGTTEEYSRLLGDELYHRAREPIAQIVQDRPPRKFEALWRADTGASCDPRDYSVCDRQGCAAAGL